MTMWHLHGGIFSSYLADLTFPPWFYMVIRGPVTTGQRTPRLLKWFGVSPERAALSIFIVGLVSEISQRYWPHGLFGGAFSGTFDPLDIAVYALGLAVCYICDKRQLNHIIK